MPAPRIPLIACDADHVEWVGFACGVVIVVLTAIGVVFTLVLPRAHPGFPQRMSTVVTRVVRALLLGVARGFADYAKVDGVLALVGPVALLAQLATWLVLFFVGYALMQWPFVGSFTHAVPGAAASLFTVGLSHPAVGANAFLTVLSAATGAIVVALQIAYLPSIYSAFNRRESLVTMLESRAGIPAWGPELLARHQLVGIVDTLAGLYGDWEQWAAEVSESHTTYPVLIQFRSPETWYSWVLSLLAVLDAAALHLALNPSTAPSQARLCLRMGFTALRRLATSLRWEWDPDPSPDSQIALTFEDFDHAVGLLAGIGFEMERSSREAWPHFSGWRVNYEALAYRLADHTVAPPAPWSGPRSHLRVGVVLPNRPPHRAPGGSIKSYSLSGRPNPPSTGQRRISRRREP